MALLEQDISFPRGWYDTHTGLTRRGTLTEFKHSQELDINIDSAVIACERYYNDLAHTVEVIPEIADIATTMHSEVPLAVTSSGSRKSVTASLIAIQLLDYFDQVVAAEDVTEHKPSPEAYKLTSSLLRVDPSRCLVFEDSDEGIEAAMVAGCSVIDVRNYASIYD